MKAKRTGGAAGTHSGRAVREHRLLLTTAAEDQLRSIIEGALRRRTIAHVSGFDINRDVAMEIFTLEPERTDRHDATTFA